MNLTETEKLQRELAAMTATQFEAWLKYEASELINKLWRD